MNPFLTKLFKVLLLSLMLGLSTLVLALPTPKEIAASVQSGQFDRAETQLREVLKAKPDSAKAHYELGQVLARQGRYIEAEQALNEARRLEPSLKFATSAQQFNELLGKVTAKTAAPVQSAPLQAAPAPARVAPPAPTAAPRSESSTPWGLILLGLAGVALVIVWLRRSAAAKPLPVATYPAATAAEPRGFGQAYSPTPAYPQANAPGYPAAPMGGAGAGSTVRGAVVGGLAGLAAGYALSKAMDGNQQHGSSGLQNEGYRSLDNAPAQPDLGSFDAGAGGDNWDNAPESGGSDDW
jgi:hypothetical protein